MLHDCRTQSQGDIVKVLFWKRSSQLGKKNTPFLFLGNLYRSTIYNIDMDNASFSEISPKSFPLAMCP